MQKEQKLRKAIKRILGRNINASSFDSRDTQIYGIDESTKQIISLIQREKDKAVEIIGDLIDSEDCSLDHHGNCQNHGYSMPCPHPIAKAFIEHNRKAFSPEVKE